LGRTLLRRFRTRSPRSSDLGREFPTTISTERNLDVTDTLRIGIVGCGWISGWHARAIARIPGAELVACCDVSDAAASSFSEKYGCENSFTDYEVMLKEANLDAVVLATWPTDHRDQVLACFEAGVVNVLCEKSITADASEVVEIWEATRERGAFVMEGFAYRYHPTMRILDTLLDDGAIGEVDNISVGFENFDPEDEALDNPNRNWRSRKELRGGVPFDILCYCVNASNHLSRSVPVRAMAVAKDSPRYGTVHRLYGVIEYANGVVATVSTSKRSDFNYELRVSGATGNVVVPSFVAPNRFPPRETVDDGEYTEVFLRRGTDLFAWSSESIQVPAADPFLLQMLNFVEVIRGEARPVVPLAESVYNVLTIEALLASSANGGAAVIEAPERVRQEFRIDSLGAEVGAK
jgi:dihydrodiol dehydrogenase / D-xylose 1-dehydrogenase (NADP)